MERPTKKCKIACFSIKAVLKWNQYTLKEEKVAGKNVAEINCPNANITAFPSLYHQFVFWLI